MVLGKKLFHQNPHQKLAQTQHDYWYLLVLDMGGHIFISSEVQLFADACAAPVQWPSVVGNKAKYGGLRLPICTETSSLALVTWWRHLNHSRILKRLKCRNYGRFYCGQDTSCFIIASCSLRICHNGVAQCSIQCLRVSATKHASYIDCINISVYSFFQFRRLIPICFRILFYRLSGRNK